MNHPTAIYAQADIVPPTLVEESNGQHHNELQERYGWMIKFVWYIATLGHSVAVYESTREQRHRAREYDPDQLPADYVSLATEEWERALQYLTTEWKTSRLGCILFVPLSVALLQINTVSQNVLARTSAIAAFIFSLIGLILGIVFMLLLSQFNRRKCRNEWTKASRNFDDLESVEFWSFLAFPMSLLIWSVLFCASTILILAWNTFQAGGSLPNGTTKASTIISATFLMALTMSLLALMYRCRQITKRLI